MNEKCAVAYLRKNEIIVGPENMTTDGVWLDRGPYRVLSKSSSNEEVGKAIINALNNSKMNIPHPTSWLEATTALEAAASVKSYQTFLKGASCCQVKFSEEYEITPMLNGGSTGENRGFHIQPSRLIKINSNQPISEVGNAVLKSLANES